MADRAPIPPHEVASQLSGIRDALVAVAVSAGQNSIANGGTTADAVAASVCEAFARLEGAALALVEEPLDGLDDDPDDPERHGGALNAPHGGARLDRIDRAGGRVVLPFPGGDVEVPG